MKTLFYYIIITLSIISCTNNQEADILYVNGKIYTVNEVLPWAEAVAIKDGKFIKVGSDDEVKVLKGENTKVVDLKGQFVMPLPVGSAP